MRKMCLLGVVFAVCLAAMPSKAAVIVFDTGSGWTAASAIPPTPFNTSIDAESTANVHGSGLPTSGYGVQLSGLATGAGIRDDLVYEATEMATPVTGYDMVGNGVFGVEIDFYTGSTSYNPQTLSLYFQTVDGFSWYYNLAAPASAGWNSYTLILPSSYGSWYSPDGGTSFTTSLGGGVTRAGLRFLYPVNNAAAQFGIGNFEYHDSDSYYVPEPGTYMMLSTALMSLGYTFARRRREQKKVA